MKPGSRHTSETRDKLSEAQRQVWSDPHRRRAQAERSSRILTDPEVRAKGQRTRLERRAQALGTTVERLEAEPIPREGRHAALKALFWQGMDLSAVVALHPRVPFNAVQKAKFAVIVEWFNKTGLFGGPWDHLDVLPLVQQDLL